MTLWLKFVIGLFAAAVVLLFFGLYVAGPQNQDRRGSADETVKSQPVVDPPASTEPASR